MVTGGVTGFVFSVDGVSKKGSAIRATGDTADTVDIIDTGGGTLVPYVPGMKGDLLCTARRRSITEAAGEYGEAGEEEAAVVVWAAASAAGASAGVAATGSTLGGGSGGGSRQLTLLMLIVAVLFSSFPRLYESSILVHLGRGVVTFSTTPLNHLVYQFLPKRRLHSA